MGDKKAGTGGSFTVTRVTTPVILRSDVEAAEHSTVYDDAVAAMHASFDAAVEKQRRAFWGLT